jgi:hypothetical protein
MQKEYMLVVTYPGNRFSWFYDQKVIKLVRREDTGTGFGFGERDVEFLFKNKQAAYRAARKVRNHLSNTKAKVWTADP